MQELVATADFDKEVLHASTLQPVLVFFTAPWCAPCRQLRRVFEEIKPTKYAAGWKFVEINVENHPALTEKYNVPNIPQTMFFRNAEKVDVVIGATNRSDILRRMLQIAPLPADK